MSTSQTIPATDLMRLHPKVIDDEPTVASILKAARDQRVALSRGMNRSVEPERAWIRTIKPDALVLETENFNQTGREQIFLRFEIAGLPYFFAVIRLSPEHESPLTVERPKSIYQFERRERLRTSHSGQLPYAQVSLGGQRYDGHVVDRGPGGASVLVPNNAPVTLGEPVEYHTNGSAERAHVVGTSDAPSPGWRRIHLSSRAPIVPLAHSVRPRILERKPARRARDRLKMGIGGAAALVRSRLGIAPRRQAVEVVDFDTEDGEHIRGIVDRCGAGDYKVGIIVPPAWGRTKETLMPFAEVAVSSFEEADISACVLRFDGVRKRGESYNDPEFRAAGREHFGFTFYQGVRDIRAAARYAKGTLGAEKLVLVTFSAASVEGRKFLAEDAGALVDGWVSVVGTADMQSMMRVISGGVDYAAGYERGLRFGLQEILGVTVDIDVAGADAAEHNMSFLEDSVRDFERITVPIRWIHGKYDAWMSLSRIRRALGCGHSRNRQIEVLPCGHQLRSSREAVEVFQRVVEHSADVAGFEQFRSSPPNIGRLAAKQRAERGRLRAPNVDLGEFWSDYLLGRSRVLGIELMNATPDYQKFMAKQVEGLRIEAGATVVDVGCGVGPLLRALGGRRARVIGLDFVRGALVRARRVAEGSEQAASFAACDASTGALPLKSASADALLASLFLSYVDDPAAVLFEIARVLRPGGRAVLSTMRPDADVSLIYTRALDSIDAGAFDAALPGVSREDLKAAGREFLNDAARLLDLEESGKFRFWSADELEAMVEAAGLRPLTVEHSFGDPAQALVVCAER